MRSSPKPWFTQFVISARKNILDTFHAIDILNGLLLFPLFKHILNKRFTSFITTPHKWPRGNIQKPHFLRETFPHLKFFRSYIFRNFHMSLCRTHVLAESDYIYTNISQIFISLKNEAIPFRVCSTCPSFSPKPSMILVFVIIPGFPVFLACSRTRRDWR